MAISLEEFDTEFEQTKPAERKEDEMLGPGKYVGYIKLAMFGITKTGKKKFTLLLKSGEGIAWKSYLLTTEGFPYLKFDLHLLGFQNAKLSEIADDLTRFEGLEVDFTVAEKNGYTNVYLNNLVNSPVQEPMTAPTSTEDIPF